MLSTLHSNLRASALNLSRRQLLFIRSNASSTAIHPLWPTIVDDVSQGSLNNLTHLIHNKVIEGS